MSEKRSWDIQPNRRPSSPPQQSPARRPAPQPVRRPVASQPMRQMAPPRQAVRRQALKPLSDLSRRAPAPQSRIERPQPPVIRREKIPQGRNREPLKNVRRRKRRRTLTTLITLIITLVIAGYICLWLPAFRVEHVDAGGQDSQGMQTIAASNFTGTMNYIFPRNSIFFFPESEIRSQILQQYPDLSAVSISRESFDSIAMDSIPRELAFLWCGTSYTAVPEIVAAPLISTASSTSATSTTPIAPEITTEASCYDADSEGFIFTADANATSSPTDALRVYGALAVATTTNASLIGQKVAQANDIPNALQFVKAIRSMGVSIVALVIRGSAGEADLYTQSGTRITYVVGQESAAVQLAQSAFPSLNLNDGSLEYVDLRFDGKVYFKKTGQNAVSDAGNAVTPVKATH